MLYIERNTEFQVPGDRCGQCCAFVVQGKAWQVKASKIR